MKDIIDLNAEIERLARPEIIFHEGNQTFSLFGTWIIETDYKYFGAWEKRILDKINNIADLDSPSKVKFIKVFYQDVLKKYSKSNEFNSENLDELKSTFSRYSVTPESMGKPQKKCSDLSFVSESWNDKDFIRFHDSIYKLGKIFYEDDFDFTLDFDYSLLDEKNHLEELIFEKYEIEELNLQVFDFNKEEKLEMFYSYVQLSLCLDKIKTLLKNIVKHLNYLVNLIKKLESFEEDKLNIDDVFAADPTDIKLEFKINKLAVAMFYRNLHDMGIIHVDNKNQKTPFTNLKKYINEANIYYLDNNKVNKVKNINKEFSKILNDKYKEYEKQELNLLDLLITNFEEKKAKLLNK
jgi:hypothetical protein